MSTCNRLDLQKLGSQPIMPIILPDHWSASNRSDHKRYLGLFTSRTTKLSHVRWNFFMVKCIKMPLDPSVGVN